MKRLRKWLFGLVLAIAMFLNSCASPYVGMPEDELYKGVSAIEKSLK